MLQGECDHQADRILAEFRRKRTVKDKTIRVRETLYGGQGGVSASSANFQDKIEAKELDHVLSEMTLLEARSEMYYKFVRKRITVRDFSLNSI